MHAAALLHSCLWELGSSGAAVPWSPGAHRGAQHPVWQHRSCSQLSACGTEGMQRARQRWGLPVLQGLAAKGPQPLVLHVGTSASAAPLHVRTFADTAREHFEACLPWRCSRWTSCSRSCLVPMEGLEDV